MWGWHGAISAPQFVGASVTLEARPIHTVDVQWLLEMWLARWLNE